MRRPALCVSLVSLALAVPASAQVSAYDWTVHYVKFQGQAQQLGDVLHFYGPNNHDELEAPDVAIWAEAVAPVAGQVSVAVDFQNLDWAPQYDAPVAFVDGVMQFPAGGSYPTGSYGFSFEVEAGQSFGFGVWSADADQGPGIADFHDLVFAPTTWHDAGGAIDPREWMTLAPPAGTTDYGASVAELGDLDGDGRSDVAVGAPASDRVLVHAGSDGAVLLDLTGPDGFGQVVSGAGDFDDDGLPDILVGMPAADGAFTDAGRAEVRSGLDGSLLFAIEGEAAGSALGTALAPARDVDGDGFEDVLVGAPGMSPWTADGYVLLLGGPSGRLIRRFETGAATFGSAVTWLGDVDGDGTREVVASGLIGTAWVLSGATGAVISIAEQPGFGGFSTGPSLAALGDVDGDSKPDFVFGDPSTSIVTFGNLSVFSSATGAILHNIAGQGWFDVVGREVAGGDFDGDGLSDFAFVASHGFDENGRVFIASGASGFDTIHALRTVPGEGYGRSLASTAGLDFDGANDLAIGAPGGIGLRLIHALDGNGSPRLSGTGDLSPSSPFSIALTDARGHAPFVMVVGLARVDLPTKGGVLVPFPTSLFTLSTNASGSFSVSSTWPAAVPGGITLWMQAWVVDPDGPYGFAASNGLGGETP